MSDPRSPELEAMIAEDPQDLARYAVYADWLLARGSVRGELAVVQLQLEAGEQPGLRAREQELLDRHPGLFHVYEDGKRSYGTADELFRLDCLTMVEWRGGFLYRLGSKLIPQMLEGIMATPAARLLHTLHVVHERHPGNSLEHAVGTVARAGPIALRQLWLGDPLLAYFERFAECSCPGLDRLGSSCPRLEQLRVIAPRFDFGDTSSIEFAELLEFDARMGATSEAVSSLARVSLPKLHTLHLGFEFEGMRLPWTLETIDPLVTGATMPGLRRLFLWGNGEPGPELIARVQASPLGQRLEQLELLDDETFEDSDGLYTVPVFAT